MKLPSSLAFIIYWLVLSADCLLLFNGLDDYRFYTKPLLMPLLYMVMAFETFDTSHRRSKAIISIALLFSLAGDFLLLNMSEKNYFTAGLLCFLVVHILYTLFFLRIKGFSLKRAGIIGIAILLVLAYQAILLFIVWQRIVENDFTLQVLAYSASIALMFVASVNTSAGKRASKVAWRYFIPGAVLFIISDSLLAIGKFYPFMNPPRELFAALNCGVMLTYGAAQILLVLGSVKFIKN